MPVKRQAQKGGFDGRGPRLPDSVPIDLLRSEVGFAGYLSGTARTTLITIPSNKVFHLRSIMISGLVVGELTVQLRQSGGVAGTATISILRVYTSNASNSGIKWTAMTDLVGFLITASTTARKYITASAITLTAYIQVGGIMRERCANDQTS